jgi:hypothetical protein
VKFKEACQIKQLNDWYPPPDSEYVRKLVNDMCVGHYGGPIGNVLPHGDQPRAMGALNVDHGMVADKNRLVRSRTAAPQCAAKDLRDRLADTFLLGHKDRVENGS